MTHTLSDIQIARLVGAQSFSRGMYYAQSESVRALSWSVTARLFDSVMTDGAAGGSTLSAADIRELLA